MQYMPQSYVLLLCTTNISQPSTVNDAIRAPALASTTIPSESSARDVVATTWTIASACQLASVDLVRGLGTLINTGTVLAGGSVGYFIGHRIPENIRTIVVQVIGLATLFMGIENMLGTHNLVFPLVGMTVGAIVGELLKIEDRLESLGAWLKRKFTKEGDEGTFVQGFVTATLLFCIGPMTILGAIEDASGRTPQLYIIKGTLDGFMSIIFVATYGIGAAFSAVSVFVVQGLLTLGGTGIDSLLDDRMRTELFAAGGFCVLAIGLNLLEIKRIKLGSLLPGLILTPILVALFAV
jgi:uncharacterized membrane protein YqgA involved in biofilm formation